MSVSVNSVLDYIFLITILFWNFIGQRVLVELGKHHFRSAHSNKVIPDFKAILSQNAFGAFLEHIISLFGPDYCIYCKLKCSNALNVFNFYIVCFVGQSIFSSFALERVLWCSG